MQRRCFACGFWSSARAGANMRWAGRSRPRGYATASIARRGRRAAPRTPNSCPAGRWSAQAEAAIDAAMLGGRFGTAGAELVIEAFLAGEEASFFALVDGTHALALAGAQDHKAVGDGDTGPNTGGMGAYSPAPCLTAALEADIMARIIAPTVAA